MSQEPHNTKFLEESHSGSMSWYKSPFLHVKYGAPPDIRTESLILLGWSSVSHRKLRGQWPPALTAMTMLTDGNIINIGVGWTDRDRALTKFVMGYSSCSRLIPRRKMGSEYTFSYFFGWGNFINTATSPPTTSSKNNQLSTQYQYIDQRILNLGIYKMTIKF